MTTTAIESHDDVPSDAQITAAFALLPRTTTAAKLCDVLVACGHRKSRAQLGIQRAMDRGTIEIGSDFAISLAIKPVSAIPHAVFSGDIDNPFSTCEGIHPGLDAALRAAERLEDSGSFCAVIPLVGESTAYMTEGACQ